MLFLGVNVLTVDRLITWRHGGSGGSGHGSGGDGCATTVIRQVVAVMVMMICEEIRKAKPNVIQNDPFYQLQF